MQIRALEEELGGALFMRTSRRVELSAAGMLLRDEARRTRELAAHAKETVQRALRGETGRVRVAFAGNAVFAWRMVVALHRGHPMAARKRLKVRMLIGEPLILYTSTEDDDSILTPLSAAMGSAPRVAHRAANTLTVLALAASGPGFAIVPEPLQQVAVPGLAFVPLDEPSLRADLLLTSRRSETNGAVKTFVSLSQTLSRQSRRATAATPEGTP